MKQLNELEFHMAAVQTESRNFFRDLDKEINDLGKDIAKWLGDDPTQMWYTSPAEPLRLLQDFRLKVTGRKK